jgi:hypothetical protein
MASSSPRSEQFDRSNSRSTAGARQYLARLAAAKVEGVLSVIVDVVVDLIDAVVVAVHVHGNDTLIVI